MPTIPLDGEIPTILVDYLDFGGNSKRVEYPDCEGGIRRSRGHFNFGTVVEDCDTCEGKGVL